jgi:hypothetical protein
MFSEHGATDTERKPKKLLEQVRDVIRVAHEF